MIWHNTCDRRFFWVNLLLFIGAAAFWVTRLNMVGTLSCCSGQFLTEQLNSLIYHLSELSENS